jgi:hypothetical protein
MYVKVVRILAASGQILIIDLCNGNDIPGF